MAKQTVIRSKKKHEVALPEGGHLATSTPAHAGSEAPVTGEMPTLPPSIVLRHEGDSPEPVRVPVSKAKAKTPARKAAAPAAKRSAPRKRSQPSAPAPETTPPSPRLPARVPADSLWEADSDVMRRLQALTQRNAQLSEQMQRLRTPSLPKGH